MPQRDPFSFADIAVQSNLGLADAALKGQIGLADAMKGVSAARSGAIGDIGVATLGNLDKIAQIIGPENASNLIGALNLSEMVGGQPSQVDPTFSRVTTPLELQGRQLSNLGKFGEAASTLTPQGIYPVPTPQMAKSGFGLADMFIGQTEAQQKNLTDIEIANIEANADIQSALLEAQGTNLGGGRLLLKPGSAFMLRRAANQINYDLIPDPDTPSPKPDHVVYKYVDMREAGATQPNAPPYSTGTTYTPTKPPSIGIPAGSDTLPEGAYVMPDGTVLIPYTMQ